MSDPLIVVAFPPYVSFIESHHHNLISRLNMLSYVFFSVAAIAKLSNEEDETEIAQSSQQILVQSTPISRDHSHMSSQISNGNYLCRLISCNCNITMSFVICINYILTRH